MYSDISKKLEGIDSRLGNLEEGQKGLVNDIVRLENKLDTNSKALFDGYSQTYGKLQDIEAKIDTLSEKVNTHDIKRFRLLKAQGGKGFHGKSTEYAAVGFLGQLRVYFPCKLTDNEYQRLLKRFDFYSR